MYRIVHCRMWRRGASFRNLSGPRTPNAQHLWLYLLTGDATIAIPGVIPLTREGLASRLDWKASTAFDSCVEEISAAGMASFDWKSGLVWCPSSFKFNKPQSPNVVRSWGKAFDVLPECRLKVQIWKAIGAFCTELGEAFRQAFDEAFPEAFDEGFLLLLHDPVTDPSPVKASAPKKAKALTLDLKEFEPFWSAYPNKKGKEAARRAWAKARKDGRILPLVDVGKRAFVEGWITVDAVVEHVQQRAETDRDWLKEDGQYIPHASTFLNQSRWTDSWKPSKRSRHDPGASEWEYDTYRKADSKRHHEHPQWLVYVSAAADLPPRSAPPFEEWLKGKETGRGQQGPQQTEK